MGGTRVGHAVPCLLQRSTLRVSTCKSKGRFLRSIGQPPDQFFHLPARSGVICELESMLISQRCSDGLTLIVNCAYRHCAGGFSSR